MSKKAEPMVEHTAHTPGPWTIAVPRTGFSAITGPQGQLVFGLAAGGEAERRPEPECDANARLIAAAPDLLEALKVLADRSHPGPRVADAEPFHVALKAALAAIAKAQGGEL